jgi:gluconolactonase
MKKYLPVTLAFPIALLLACGDGAGPEDDSSVKEGDEAGVVDADTLDGAEGDRPDSGRTMDAGSNSGRDGGPLDARASEAGSASDGGARDATENMRDATSAQGDAGQRAQVCGEETTWPAPFMGMTIAAQPVGSNTFGFLEGPVWIAEEGVLLFSDMDMGNAGALGPPARIRRLRPPSTFDVFVQTSNSNGLALWQGNALLAATHDTQSLSLFKLDSGARTELAVLADGKHFNSPNDLTVRSDGTVYFTDPDWQIASRPSETMKTGVYRLPPPLRENAANSALLVDGTLDKPNGIALSPDERTLYVGSSGNEIWKYAVQADGSLGQRTMFATTGSSDGLTIDCAGNVYVTSGTVEVFAADGMRRGEITLGGQPSNVAFGGADRKTLYITAGSRLYSVKLNVPGYPY